MLRLRIASTDFPRYAFNEMARRAKSSADVPGLTELVDRGVLLPATRRLSEVLAAHAPVKLADSQAGSRALDEQRSERA
jgi:hypothetical protein